MRAGFSRVRLDHEGIGEVMRSDPMRQVVAATTRTVAQAAKSATGGRVLTEVEEAVPGAGIRDRRPVGRVTLATPGGAAAQVRIGALTRAAAAAGLEVTEYPQ